MLMNLEKIFKDFVENDIHFCHWKSNINIDDACNGVGDLDLLFCKTQYALVTNLLVSNDFKRAESKLDRQYPGVEDYFGYDRQSGKIVHLQAHYQLVTGQPLSKNYHFPIEGLILSNLPSDSSTPIPVPNKSLELILHVCRSFIKLGPKIVIRPALFKKHHAKALDEALHLMPGRISHADEKLIREGFPFIDYELLMIAVSAVTGPSKPFAWLKIRRNLLSELSVLERRSSLGGVSAWITRRLYIWFYRKIAGTFPKRSLATGGFGMAVVGSDGAGKSTAIEGMKSWLGGSFTVKHLHMGKPSPSLRLRIMSRLVRLVSRCTNNNLILPKAGMVGSTIWPSWLAWIPAYLYIALANDRWKCYMKARRYIGSGAIVVCDRFPLPDIKLMDSPKIKEISNVSNPFYSRLAKKEQKIYDKLSCLDMTFLLVVSPDVAVTRQPGDGDEYVKTRANEVLSFSKNKSSNMEIIDAHQSIENVQKSLKEIIWNCI